MADALPGAVAPIPAAIRTEPPLFVPSQAQLLAYFADSLKRNGDPNHPWVLLISATLAKEANDGAQHGRCDRQSAKSDYPVGTASRRHAAGQLFQEIAEAASSLIEFLPQAMDGSPEQQDMALAGLARLGWLADAASVAHGNQACRGDAATWFLRFECFEALGAVTLAATEQGGAA